MNRDVAARRVASPPRPGDLDGVAHDLRGIDRRQRTIGAQARKLLDAAHGLAAVHRRLFDHRQLTVDLRLEVTAAHQLHATQDRPEQVVEVVGDATRQLTQRA